jgi:hypothetical protein
MRAGRPGRVVALSDSDLDLLEADLCPETPSYDAKDRIPSVLQEIFFC